MPGPALQYSSSWLGSCLGHGHDIMSGVSDQYPPTSIVWPPSVPESRADIAWLTEKTSSAAMDGTGGGAQAVGEAVSVGATGDATDASGLLELPPLGFVPARLHPAIRSEASRTTNACDLCTALHPASPLLLRGSMTLLALCR